MLRRLPFRDDVLAARGLFALLIVVYHLWHVPSGGPVGIDLFFVISGYLITRQLVEERVRTGRVSMIAFFARRLRRIAPVAVVVVVVTVLVSSMVWYLPRAVVIAGDGVSALGLVANWHFISQGDSYLSPTATPSPLEHTWSLSVEEQFYLLWPSVLVLAASGIGPGEPRRVARRVVVAACAALAITVAWSAWRTAAAPDIAYFDTVARSWEFLPGVVAGALASRIDGIDERIRTAIGSLGFLVLVAAAIWVDPDVGFPWPGAVPGVLGSMLFVAFGVHRGLAERMLTSGAARFLGRISYPLYLWHFPVVILLPVVFGRSVPVFVAAALLSVVLAALTSRWVETPVLASNWLRRWTNGDRRLVSLHGKPTRRLTAIVAGASALVLLVGGAAVQPSWGRVRTVAAIAALAGASRSAPLHVWEDTSSLDDAVDRALRARQWPEDLEPGLDHAFTSTVSGAFDEVTGCRYPAGSPSSVAVPCDSGPSTAAHTALLLGDSTAAAWSPGVVDALVPLGWRVRTLSFSACPPFSPALTDEGAARACASAHEASLVVAEETAPDLVILSAGGETWTNEAASRPRDDGFRADWAAALTLAVGQYRAVADDVVMLGPAPHGPHTTDCAVRVAGPLRCTTTLPEDEVRASCVPDVDCIDVSSWFCDASRACPAFIGSTLVRADGSHLTERMARSLSTLLRRAILQRTRAAGQLLESAPVPVTGTAGATSADG